MAKQQMGLFVGLMTLDLIYRVAHPPLANQKLVASDCLVMAGGPATNAAIAFHHLHHLCPDAPSLSTPGPSTPGPSALILTSLGHHPLAQLPQTEAESWGVAIADLVPGSALTVPVSSIMVTEATGERAVVSRNAVNRQGSPDDIPKQLWQTHWPEAGVVLIDGHQMAVGEAIAARAQREGIPVVVDGGSWKSGFEGVLCHADYVLCSANFSPPTCTSSQEVYRYLKTLGIAHVAITHGAEAIEYWGADAVDADQPPQRIAVPAITPVDTLGAGDIFHGAFCHYLLEAILLQEDHAHSVDIAVVLAKAAAIASRSCQYAGPRAWMDPVAP